MLQLKLHSTQIKSTSSTNNVTLMDVSSRVSTPTSVSLLNSGPRIQLDPLVNHTHCFLAICGLLLKKYVMFGKHFVNLWLQQAWQRPFSDVCSVGSESLTHCNWENNRKDTNVLQMLSWKNSQCYRSFVLWIQKSDRTIFKNCYAKMHWTHVP